MDKSNQTPITQQPQPQQASKYSFLFKIISTIFILALSIAWIILSKLYLSDTIKNKVFSKNPLKTLNDSVDLIADIGLYAALYLVSLTFTVMLIRIIKHSVNPATQARVGPAERTNELIRSFTHSLIVFGCLFLYLMENSKKSIKLSCGFLLPVWFLSGYVASWVGNLFDLLFKRDLGFIRLGQFVILWTFVILLSQISGFRIFELI